MQHPPALLETPVPLERQSTRRAPRAHRDDESTFKRVGTEWFYNLINRASAHAALARGDFRPDWTVALSMRSCVCPSATVS